MSNPLSKRPGRMSAYGPGFQDARLVAARRSDGICQFCGRQPERDGHHWARRYPPDSKITGDDITSLCGPCHRIATAIRRHLAKTDGRGLWIEDRMEGLADKIESLFSDDPLPPDRFATDAVELTDIEQSYIDKTRTSRR